MTDFKFNEPKYLDELETWIENTYDGHYGSHDIQAIEVIIDAGHGTGFCLGSIMKYSKRYGLKNGFDRTDLLKIAHDALLLLHILDKASLGEITKNPSFEHLVGEDDAHDDE